MPPATPVEKYWEVYTGKVGAWATAASIQPTPFSAICVELWVAVAAGGALSSGYPLPTISGGGCTNWKPIPASFPQQTPTSNKGKMHFIGQAGATPSSQPITVTFGAGTTWSGYLHAFEAKDVLVDLVDPRNILDQFVVDKKHADNFGGYGGDADEVTRLTRSATGMTGNITLTWNGQTTGNIPIDTAGFTAAAVQSALEALSNIGVGEADCYGPAGGPIDIWFKGTLAAINQPDITVNIGGASGGTVSRSSSNGGGSVPILAKLWFPQSLDPTPDNDHLVVCTSFHGDGTGTTCKINDFDGWSLFSTTDGTTPGARVAGSGVNISSCFAYKMGFEVGDKPAMYNWQSNFISTGGVSWVFKPKDYVAPFAPARRLPTVHWVSDKGIASVGAAGRWPIELTYNIVDQAWLDRMAMIYVIATQEGQDWDVGGVWAAAGFQEPDPTNMPIQTAVGSPNGERLVVLWKRPVAGSTAPTFPDSGAHNIVAGFMLDNVERSGNIFHATNFGIKTTPSPDAVIPNVDTTITSFIMAIAARGSATAAVKWPNGPSIEYGPFTPTGAVSILRPESVYNIAGGGTDQLKNIGASGGDSGRELEGEVRIGTTAGGGGGLNVLTALQIGPGPSGTFVSTLLNSASEVYSVLAIIGPMGPPGPGPIVTPPLIIIDRTHRYTYMTADIMSGEIIAELPMRGVKFNKVLKGTGTFDGEVNLGDVHFQDLDLLDATDPGRRVVYVDMDGALLWGGIIWGRKYSSQAGKLSISAVEFFSYFVRQFLLVDSINLFSNTQVEQFEMMRAFLNYVQNKPGGNLGIINSDSKSLSGILRDREWFDFEFKQIAEAMSQLSDVENGFDFGFDVRWNNNRPERYMWLAYPRAGRTVDNTGLLFDKPGNINSFEFSEDASTMSTDTWSTGEGEDDLKLIAHASDPGLFGEGYPALEQVTDYNDVVLLPTLQGHANMDQRNNRHPYSTMSLSVNSDMEPSLQQIRLGDDARVKIASGDLRFPDGIDEPRRIIAWELNPESSEYSLTLEDVQIL